MRYVVKNDDGVFESDVRRRRCDDENRLGNVGPLTPRQASLSFCGKPLPQIKGLLAVSREYFFTPQSLLLRIKMLHDDL